MNIYVKRELRKANWIGFIVVVTTVIALELAMHAIK